VLYFSLKNYIINLDYYAGGWLYGINDIAYNFRLCFAFMDSVVLLRCTQGNDKYSSA
jgi:hypothetical protein